MNSFYKREVILKKKKKILMINYFFNYIGGD